MSREAQLNFQLQIKKTIEIFCLFQGGQPKWSKCVLGKLGPFKLFKAGVDRIKKIKKTQANGITISFKSSSPIKIFQNHNSRSATAANTV